MGARTQILLVAVVSTLSLSTAKAQTPEAPPATVDEALPSKPEGPLPAPGPLKLIPPLSQHLLLMRGPSFWSGSFEIDRAGVTVFDSRLANGLDQLLAGSDRAVDLAHGAQTDLTVGMSLFGVGIATMLGGLTASILVDTNAGNGTITSSNQSLSLGLVIGGVLLGAVIESAGQIFQLLGTRAELDAVNAYNSDLVDGRLRFEAPNPEE